MAEYDTHNTSSTHSADRVSHTCIIVEMASNIWWKDRSSTCQTYVQTGTILLYYSAAPFFTRYLPLHCLSEIIFG